MSLQIDNRIILIKRNTRLDDLIVRFNTIAQAKFYVEYLGQAFTDYLDEHNKYYDSIDSAKKIISGFARLQVLDRKYLPNFVFARDDIVVSIGQDGLLANTLKYLRGQPIIGVNPDPDRWDGVLLPFQVPDIATVVMDLVLDKRGCKDVTMGEVNLTNGQSLLAVNDFFIGQKTHSSARYMIRFQDQAEQHSSSGIIVSTGLGSSGWLRSVVAGASGIAGNFFAENGAAKNENNEPAIQENSENPVAMDWSEDMLTFSVREPFPSRNTGTNIVFGRVTPQRPLTIVSQMGENGVIFSDGIENDFIEFNSGMEAVVSIASVKGKLVV